jgi:hypothetical protein
MVSDRGLAFPGGVMHLIHRRVVLRALGALAIGKIFRPQVTYRDHASRAIQRRLRAAPFDPLLKNPRIREEVGNQGQRPKANADNGATSCAGDISASNLAA